MALTVLLVAGCSKPCIKGTGPTETRTLQVADFTKISVDGAIEVIVERGEPLQVTATAQAELIDLLNTSVSNGTWAINTSQCWRSGKGFVVHVVTPNPLSGIETKGSGNLSIVDAFDPGNVELSSKGSGDVSLEGLGCKKLSIMATGSGNMTARGTTAVLDGNFLGSGNLEARDLAANVVNLKMTGSGDATVTAISSLNVKLSGSGNVRYAGNPDVKSKLTGSGAVLRAP